MTNVEGSGFIVMEFELQLRSSLSDQYLSVMGEIVALVLYSTIMVIKKKQEHC